MESFLESGLGALHQISERKLTEILDKIHGKKDLVIDPVLMKPLEHITGITVLRSHGVEKIYKLEKIGKQSVNLQTVYLIYSDLITAKHVSDQINSERQKSTQCSYHLILIPCELLSIQQLLEEEGIYGLVTVYTFPWELIRLDNTVLSLELPDLFRMLFVDGDQSFMPAVARSLWSLQHLFGKFPLTLATGRFSSRICAMLDTLLDELGAPPAKTDSAIGCLVLVDRDVDYTSTLLTPVTYIGLLDEVFGIHGGTIELDSRVTGNKEMVNYQLSGKDTIYNEIKNRHFSDVFSFLSSKAKELQLESECRQKMALQEMKHYVTTKLQKVTDTKRSLSYHIGACEVIIGEMGHRFESLHRVERNLLEGRNKRESINYIENCLATQSSGRLALLRLLSLLSLTQDGLLQDEATTFKTQYLHCYGYEHLNSFHNLERIGLFARQGISVLSGDAPGKLSDRVAQVVSLPKRGSAFRTTAYKLKLFPDVGEDYDARIPKDMGYVFSGAYIPAVCQMIHLLIKRELPPDEVLKLLPGICTHTGKMNSDITPRTFLVYFIGGVTYAEIAAFQLLEKLTGARILVAGTTIINGNKLVQSLL